MGILKSISNAIKGKNGVLEYDAYIESLIQAKSMQLVSKKKAIDHAIDMIASTISKCSIQCYEMNLKTKKIEEVKGEIYYKLNVQPNKNEQGTSFFYRVITNLLHNTEILILEINHNLYISTDWVTDQAVLREKTYSNIQIIDEEDNVLLLNRTFSAHEVIHLSVKEKKITECINEYFKEFGTLLDVSYNQFINKNTSKWRLGFNGSQPVIKDAETKKEISYDEYVSKITDGLFGEEDKVILLSEQFNLQDLMAGKEISASKFLELEEKAENEVAKAFSIPLDMFHGNKTDKSTSSTDFFTFAIIPILQILEDGLNARIIPKNDYLKGEYIAFNRWNMKHMDIIEASSGMDKLFSNGFSHNEICGFLNVPKLNEKWADEHYITKNYDLAENSLKGGEKDE